MLSALFLATLLAPPDAGVRPAPAPVELSRPAATPVEEAVLAGVPANLARELTARAEARGVAAEAALAPVVKAARAGIPAASVAAKVLEGLAKGVAADRVLAVAGALADRLRQAALLLEEGGAAGVGDDPAGDPARRAGMLADLADALGAGVPPAAIRALVEAARAAGRRCDSVVAAARTLGELARRGIRVADAMPLATALAARPPLPTGEIARLYDAYLREGGEGAGPFLAEARRRAARGEPLEDLVDHFGETPDHVNRSRGAPSSSHGDLGRGHGRGDLGAIPGLDTGRGRARGHVK